MKYGLLEYTTANIGDEIQSIAAQQHLPQVDIYLRRDYLNEVKSEEKIKLIMNGWFSHEPQNWPPSSDIEPLFVSFHISNKAKEAYTSPKSIEYLSKHEPIGCRDYHTRDLLIENDIDAYFSGCLTMTLTNEYSNHNPEGIYLVDLNREVISNLPRDIRKRAERLTHVYPINKRISTSKNIKSMLGSSKKYTSKVGLDRLYNYIWDRIRFYTSPKELDRTEKFQKAKKYLNKYAQAELVITSRLHATLPCIAFNTPVILVHENPEDPRFGGLKEYINLYSPNEFANTFDPKMLSNLTNPGDISRITRNMETDIEKFLDP